MNSSFVDQRDIFQNSTMRRGQGGGDVEDGGAAIHVSQVWSRMRALWAKSGVTISHTEAKKR